MAEAVSPDADGLVGGVTIWPSDILPGAKYRFCEGEAISRTEFSLCFARLGTKHGVGDGSTTFGLPDYTGTVLVCVDASDNDFDTVGQTGGTKAATMPAHGHTLSGAPGVGSLAVSPNPHSHAQADGNVTTVAGGAVYNLSTINASGLTTGGTSLSVVGAPSAGTLAVANAVGGGNNMPPYTTVRFVIKIA